jgi:aryl-alcohol dehydrogenase-like predicted oxidoreductase
MTAGGDQPLAARRTLGWTDLSVSALSLGTMQFGWSVTDVGAFEILDRYREAGGNFIDTADMYGPNQSLRSWDAFRPHVGVTEDIVGRWMAERRCRDEMVVGTKVRARMWDGDDGEGLSRQHIEKAVDASLRRLRTDRIDLYQAHWPDLETPLEVTFEVFQDLVDAGKVRYVGTSNYGLFGQMEQVATLWERGRAPRIASEQLRYNLANRNEYEQSVKAVVLQHQIGVTCYTPLAAGFLTGKYRTVDDVQGSSRYRHLQQFANDRGFALVDAISQVASAHEVPPAAVSLAWLLAQEGVTSPIVGANSLEQLESWLPAATVSLSADNLARLDASSWDNSEIEFS